MDRGNGEECDPPDASAGCTAECTIDACLASVGGCGVHGDCVDGSCVCKGWWTGTVCDVEGAKECCSTWCPANGEHAAPLAMASADRMYVHGRVRVPRLLELRLRHADGASDASLVAVWRF